MQGFLCVGSYSLSQWLTVPQPSMFLVTVDRQDQVSNVFACY